MSAADNKRISIFWHEAWGTPAIERAYAECLDDDFEADFFGMGKVNKTTYIEQDRAFAAAFADSRIKVERALAEDDLVMVQMTWMGRHVGDLPGIPATGRGFRITGFGCDRFRGGKVIAHTPLFDQLAMLRQLDVNAIPPA